LNQLHEIRCTHPSYPSDRRERWLQDEYTNIRRGYALLTGFEIRDRGMTLFAKDVKERDAAGWDCVWSSVVSSDNFRSLRQGLTDYRDSTKPQMRSDNEVSYLESMPMKPRWVAG
jgi:hypothetical protein